VAAVFEHDAAIHHSLLEFVCSLLPYPLALITLLLLLVQLLLISLPQDVLERRRSSVRGVLESEQIHLQEGTLDLVPRFISEWKGEPKR
jgi:hypothetical protein